MRSGRLHLSALLFGLICLLGSVLRASALTRSLYVANQGGSSVTSYPLGGNGDISSSTAIAGSNTTFNQPYGVALDTGGTIYVLDPVNGILEFAAGSNGNVPPNSRIRITGGLSGVYSIALDSAANIFVGTILGAIGVFPAGTIGDTTPSGTISGSNTGLAQVLGVAVDTQGNMYAVSCPCGTGDYSAGSINVFAAGSNGNVIPNAIIAGSATDLHGPVGIALDSGGNIYVTNWIGGPDGIGSITVYSAGSNGNIAPTREISGSNTGLFHPQGIAVDSNGNIFVANTGANSITEYSAGSNGNVTPISTITGADTGLQAPQGIAIGPNPSSPPKLLVGLGDSVAAGYGLGDDDNSLSYPMLVAEEWGVHHGYIGQNLAVSGAKSSDMIANGTPVSGGQLDQALRLAPDTVTLTVGANDIDFKGCLTNLFMQSSNNPCWSNLVGNLSRLSTNLKGIFALLHQANSKVQVYATQYYDPLPPAPSSGQGACLLFKLQALHAFKGSYRDIATALVRADAVNQIATLDQTSARFFAELVVNALNGTIATAAKSYSTFVHVVRIESAFDTHDVCESDAAWEYGPAADLSTLPSPLPDLLYLRLGIPSAFALPEPCFDPRPDDLALFQTGDPRVKVWANCFPHPRVQGQQQLADAVCKSLIGSTCTSSQ